MRARVGKVDLRSCWVLKRLVLECPGNHNGNNEYKGSRGNVLANGAAIKAAPSGLPA